MGDNAIDILLRLQDELSPALQKAQATLRDAARQMVDTGASGSKSFKDLDDSSAGWFTTIAAGVATGELLAATVMKIGEAVLSAAKALPELALRGAMVDDVAESFERLTSQVGRSGDALLGTLKEGTHNTISDFDLMKRANQDMAAGLNLTDQQYATLTKGAFALAQATGTDVKTALDTMSDAMITGRAKALALLTGKVDLKAAEEDFAKSLGKTTEELTAEGKMEAARQAMLEAVGKSVDRLGDQTDGLDEKVAQGEAGWRNYQDQLGRAIATSPVLMQAIDGIAQVLMKAFGGTPQQSIQTIVKLVDQFVIHVVDAGLAGLQAANVIYTAWSAIKTVVLGVATIEAGAADLVIEFLTQIASVAESLHLVPQGLTAQLTDLRTQTRAMTADLADQTREAALGVIGQSAFQQGLDKIGGSLFELRDNLSKTAAAHAQTAGAVDKDKAAHEAFVGPVQQTTEFTKESAAAVKKYAEAWEQLASIGLTVRDTVASIDPQMRAEVQLYLDAGASVGVLAAAYPQLTQAQIQAMADLKKMNADAKLEVTKLWDEYDADRAKNTGTAIDAQIAATDRWANDLAAKMQKNGTDTKAFYEALTAVWSQKLNAIMVDTASITKDLSEHTQAGLQQTADRAKATYAEALTHVGEFSDGTIEKYRLLAEKAQFAADTFGSGFQENSLKAAGAIDTVVQKAVDSFHQIEMASAAAQLARSPIGNDQADIEQGYSGTTNYRTPNEISAGIFPDPQELLRRIQHGALQSRDSGGPVVAGQTYLIGKGAQPELFTPSTNGMMVPNGAGGGSTYQIYVTQPFGTPAAIASAVDDAVMARQRNTGQRY